MKSGFVKEYLPYIRILVFGAVICILPFILSTYYTHIAVLALIWAFLAVAWNIIGGYAGQHSLGHGLYMGIGAYTVAYLLNHANMSPWISIFVAIAITAAIAWFIGYITFRYSIKGAYFALVTIALTEAAVYIVSNIQPLGGAGGIEMNLHYGLGYLQFSGAGRETSYFLFGTAMLVGILLLVQWYKSRRFFYQLIAVRENEDAAEALGVDTVKAKIKANVMSGILCAVGGIFYVQYFLYVYPRSVFGETVSVQILLFAIIGGLGTVWGPVVGAAILVPVVEITRSQLGSAFQGADLLIYGFVMVGTMLFMPFGIMGIYEKVKGRFFHRHPAQKVEDVVESGEAA